MRNQNCLTDSLIKDLLVILVGLVSSAEGSKSKVAVNELAVQVRNPTDCAFNKLCRGKEKGHRWRGIWI